MYYINKHINFLPGVNYPANAWNTGTGKYTLTGEGFSFTGAVLQILTE